MPLTFLKKQNSTPACASGSNGNANKNLDAGAAAEPRRLPAKLLDVRQAASYAGVSESTIRRWIKDGLRIYRHGKLIRIDPADIVAFMRSDGQK